MLRCHKGDRARRLQFYHRCYSLISLTRSRALANPFNEVFLFVLRRVETFYAFSLLFTVGENEIKEASCLQFEWKKHVFPFAYLIADIYARAETSFGMSNC